MITAEFLDDNLRGTMRVNLNVYSKAGVHPLHIGFFKPTVATEIAQHINARGIAFHSDVRDQIGRVNVAVCLMREGETDMTVRSLEYGPPEKQDLNSV